MAKANTPIAEKIQKKANNLRMKAKMVRAAKSEIAEQVVSGFAEGGLKQAELLAGVFEVYLHAARATRTIFAEIERDPKFRAQIETFVANIIEDVSSRLNELSNIMDSVAKSSEIQNAIEEAQTAIKGIVEQISGVKRFGKRKLSVVEDDDDAVVNTRRKSASGRKGKKH